MSSLSFDYTIENFSDQLLMYHDRVVHDVLSLDLHHEWDFMRIT